MKKLLSLFILGAFVAGLSLASVQAGTITFYTNNKKPKVESDRKEIIIRANAESLDSNKKQNTKKKSKYKKKH